MMLSREIFFCEEHEWISEGISEGVPEGIIREIPLETPVLLSEVLS